MRRQKLSPRYTRAADEMFQAGFERMMISMTETKEAERMAKEQRLAAGRVLRVDESKVIKNKREEDQCVCL